MDALSTRRRTAVLHRIFMKDNHDRPPERARTRTLLAAEALFLGLVGGWLEMAVGLGHRAVVGTVTKVSVSISRHHVPLGLLAHLAIFGAWLALAMVLSAPRIRGRRAERILAFLGGFLILASAMLSLEELHWIAGLAVAAGLAVRMAPWWVRRRDAVLRRGLLPLVAASAAVVGLAVAQEKTAESRALAALLPAAPEAPNVVLMVLDTVRADHLSLYGYARRTTPRLEALARDAICFTRARSTAPWTLPAHASMMTGHWPHELSTDYDRPLDGTFPTLAEFLADHGYATGGFVGNTFYCNGWFGIDRGFAHYEDAPENREISVQQTLRCATLSRLMMPLAVKLGIWPTIGQYPQRKVAEQVNRDALAWIDRTKAPGRPFFLFLNYIDAHGPYTIPEDAPRVFSKSSNEEVRESHATALRKGNDLRLTAAEREAIMARMSRLGFDAYDDCIAYIDQQIDRLMGELDRRGLRRNTWVIITADHGEHFGEHGKYWHGSTLYRPLVDVPLMIVPPSGVEGRRIATPASTRDLPATVADLVGLEDSSPFPGLSLRRHWLTPNGGPSGDPPLSELKLTAEALRSRPLPEEDRHRSAVIDGDRIYHRDPLGTEELYDSEDRDETRDLAQEPEEAATLQHLRKLDERLRQEGDRDD